MLKEFTQLVSKFPFAGKIVIRPAYLGFVQADKRKRTGRFAWLSSILGVMVFGHGKQAFMGVQAMRLAFSSKIKVFWHLVFVGYTAANVAVTIAQIYLLCWCVYLYLAQRHTRPVGPTADFTLKEILIMMAVTLGGQILFAYGESLL